MQTILQTSHFVNDFLLAYNIYMTTIQRFIIILMALTILFAVGFAVYRQTQIKQEYSPEAVTSTPTPDTNPPTVQAVSEPIANSLSRVTKKPYGIYITPATSPVQPERFTGYHTGTDFETTETETSTAIPVYAICDGKVRFKGTVDGYGGVIILDCTINSQVVSVLYGHIDIASSPLTVGASVAKGGFVANLAPGYSAGTAGERKHLHLGIHKGSNIDYRGYVPTQGELSGWLNYQDLYK